MPTIWWQEWTDWWSTVTPDFAFLLALPFVIGGLALLVDQYRNRRHGRSAAGKQPIAVETEPRVLTRSKP